MYEPQPSLEERNSMANEKQQNKMDPEQARLKKEEQARKAKRTSRQLIGIALSILIVVGAFSIIQGSVNLVKQMLDTTSEQEEYTKRLAPMVWFDMLPFENVAEIDPNNLKQIGIWGVMDQLGANLNRSTQGEPLVPAVEVERYLIALFGPSVEIGEHQTFTDTTFDLTYIYDEATQVYVAPSTGLQPPYLPVVVDVVRESGGVKRVVMGYVNTRGGNDELINTPDFNHPVRYMDYIFQRDGNSYYLVALQKNTTYVPPVASSVPQTATESLGDESSSVPASVSEPAMSGGEAESQEESAVEASSVVESAVSSEN